MKKGDLIVDENICKDASGKGTFASGDYEIVMKTDENLNYILSLIKQSLVFNKK